MKTRNRIISVLKLAGERGITNSEIGAITKTDTKMYPILLDLETDGRVRSQFDDEGTKKFRKRRYWWVAKE